MKYKRMNCPSIRTHSECINFVKAGHSFSLFPGSVIGWHFSTPPYISDFCGEYLECDSPLTLYCGFVMKEHEPERLTGWRQNKASYLICVVEAVIHEPCDQRRLSNCKRTKRGRSVKMAGIQKQTGTEAFRDGWARWLNWFDGNAE